MMNIIKSLLSSNTITYSSIMIIAILSIRLYVYDMQVEELKSDMQDLEYKLIINKNSNKVHMFESETKLNREKTDEVLTERKNDKDRNNSSYFTVGSHTINI